MKKIFFVLSITLLFALSFFPGRSFMIFEYNCVFKSVWMATIFFALLVYLYNTTRKSYHPTTRRSENIFVLLLLSILYSTIFSEFKDVSWFCAMPILSSLSLAYLCHNYLVSDERVSLINIARALGLFFFLIFVWSILLYTASDSDGIVYVTAENILNNTIKSPIRFLDIFTKQAQNHLPFWHCNYLAGFCVLSIPVVAGLIFTDKRGWKPLWIITFGLAVITLFTAKSRGGYLGVTVFLLLLLIVVLNAKKLPYKKSIFLAIASVFAAILINDKVRDTLIKIIFKFNFDPMGGRLSVWNTGLKIGLSNPILGNGIGTHSLLYTKFWDGNGIIPEIYQLYSTPIAIFADLGFVGIVLFGSLFCLGIYCWIRLLKAKEVVRKEKILTTAFVFSLVSYAAVSLVDYELSIYPISGSLAIIVACILASYDRNITGSACYCNKGPVRKTIQKILPIILTACFAIMVWYQYRDFMARKNFKLAVDSFYKNSNLAEAERLVNIALEWQPKNFGFLNHLSSMFTNASAHVGGNEKEFFNDKARTYLEKSIGIHKYQTYPQEILGWLYLDKDPKKAESYFQNALYMFPTNTGTFWGLGLSCLNQSKQQKAIKAFALEFLIHPETVLFIDGYNIINAYPEILVELSKYYDSHRTKDHNEMIAQLLNKLIFHWWCNRPFEGILTEIDKYTDNVSAKDFNSTTWILELFKEHGIYFPSTKDKLPPYLLCYKAYLTSEFDEKKKIIMNVLHESETEFDTPTVEAIAAHLDKSNNNYLSLIKSSIFNRSIPIISRTKNHPGFNLTHNNLDAPVLYGVYGFRCNLLVFTALRPFLSGTYLSGSELRKIVNTL